MCITTTFETFLAFQNFFQCHSFVFVVSRRCILDLSFRKYISFFRFALKSLSQIVTIVCQLPSRQKLFTLGILCIPLSDLGTQINDDKSYSHQVEQVIDLCRHIVHVYQFRKANALK